MRNIRSVVPEIFNFIYFEVIFHWMSSSFQEFLILVWSPITGVNILQKSENSPDTLFWDTWNSTCSNKGILSDLQKLNRNPWFYTNSCVNLEPAVYIYPSKHKFTIWGKSKQWLLRYSTFNNLRSSSIGGSLPLEVVCISNIFDFGLLSELKFKSWGRLPLEII